MASSNTPKKKKSATAAKSEIDEIFAGVKKGPSSSAQQTSTVSAKKQAESKAMDAASTSTLPKKRNGSSPKKDTETAGIHNSQFTTAAQIVDFAAIESSRKEKQSQTMSGKKRPLGGNANSVDDDDGFADSRGERKGKKRYTDDGYKIHYFEDLGVGKDGGGMLVHSMILQPTTMTGELLAKHGA